MTRKPLHPDPDKLTRDEWKTVFDLLCHAEDESSEPTHAYAKARQLLAQFGVQAPVYGPPGVIYCGCAVPADPKPYGGFSRVCSECLRPLR
jgi:hypothetical protein